MNNENLKPIQKGQLTSEEAKTRGSAGGKKSGEVRRQRKRFKESLEILLQMKVSDQIKGQIKKNIPKLKDKDLDYQNAIMVALIQQALKGNTKAVELIRDTIGEKPKEEVINTNENINITDETVINNVIKKLKEI